MSSNKFRGESSDHGPYRKKTKRSIESTTEISETIEEFDAETGRIASRTVRSKSHKAKLSEDETVEPAAPSEPKRIGKGLSEDWYRAVPHQLKVSVFETADRVPQELDEFAGDYILTCTARDPSSVRWEYRFPIIKGLSRLVLTAEPSGGRLAVTAVFEGLVRGPQWLGVADADMHRPFTLHRDRNVPPASFANDDWPLSIHVMALQQPARPGEEGGLPLPISPAPTEAELQAMAAFAGGSETSELEPPEPPEEPPCEEEDDYDEECGCPPFCNGPPSPPGPPGPPGPPSLGDDDPPLLAASPGGPGGPGIPPGGSGGGASGGGGFSCGPVRYSNGQISLRVTDLSMSGFGASWGHQRSYSNRLSSNSDIGQGFNWLVLDWPYLIENDDGDITVVRSTDRSLWFEQDDQTGNYVARFAAKSTLVHDEQNNLFVLTFPSGRRQEYYDFDQSVHPPGLFAREIAPGGQVTEVDGYTPADRIEEIRRSGTVAGATLTEEFVYEYDVDDRVEMILLRRKLGEGEWEEIRRAVYEYYGETENFGSLGDLKRARIQVPDENGNGWEDTAIRYYRYYVDGEPDGFVHGLKFAVGPATYDQMLADGVDPLTASDAVLATYAGNYFEYDEQQRVVLERLDGGSRTFEFDYTEGSQSQNPNVWGTRTVETRPDGSELIVYTNFLGQPLVRHLQAGSNTWIAAYRYDSQGRELWAAEPSAVLGYDDSQPDLDIQLRSDAGLIRATDYYTTTGGGAAAGYLSARKLKQGANATPVLIEEREYASHTAGGATVHPLSKRTLFRNYDGTGEIETTFDYTFHSGTLQREQTTVTLPVVPESQNGTGVAATRKTFQDDLGNVTWSMDERGFITHTLYDLATGAPVQRIEDIDTSIVSGAPSGWTTPAGGGLNLVTDFEHDDQGRITQTLGPEHEIDLSGTPTVIRRATWNVFDDVNHVTYSGQGDYVPSTQTYTLVNPVSIVKRNARGSVLEQIQAASSSTSGTLQEIIEAAGSGAAAFPQSSYTRWTTFQYSDCCKLASQRVYFDIPASGDGTSGVNYDQTDYGYDVMNRRNRTATPGGTITRLVINLRGLVTETWIGTNDDGGIASDPSGGGSDPNNNMVIVTGNQYDHGADGGDGNLTRQTQYVDSTTTRVTDFAHDFRNRRTATDGELDFYETVEYDNLSRIVKRERYDTDAQGKLIARSETKFDNRGMVYQEIQWAVDPNTGTVGNALTDNTWFDPAGNVIKTQPAGLMTQIQFEYDSISRLVKETNPLGAETTFAYDDASNRISLTDAENNTTTWRYNGVGQMVTETNALDESRTFAYDDAGMLGVRTDRNGRAIEFDYDDAGNLTEERWKEGAATVNTLRFTWDADSRLSSAADDFSSYAYGYNLMGATSEVDNDGTLGVPRVILSAGYNRQRERLSLAATIDSTNDLLSGYQYDALGRMSRIDQQSNGGNSVALKRIDFAYKVRGGYQTIHRFADLTGTKLVAKTTYQYDDFGRLTRLDHEKDTTSLASHEYSFNANRLIDQHKTVDGESDYDYDDAAQLLEALHSFETDEEYSYDLTGNRTNTGYSTGPNNQLLSDGTYTYEYDSEGNRIQKTNISTDETVEYAWDHRNRLTKVTFKDDQGQKAKAIEYVYDVHDRRIAKVLNENGNGTTDDEWHFVYDGLLDPDLANIVLVFDATGNLRNRYLHGPDVDQILAGEDSSSDVLWQLTDHLGTIRDLAEYDDQQDATSIVNHLIYDAFGQITSQSDATKMPLYAFTGREWDPDADLFYYRARWYAGVGRFVNEDPVAFAGNINRHGYEFLGEYHVGRIGFSVNPYLYANNSPVMLRDPSGLDPCRTVFRLCIASCNGAFDACLARGHHVLVCDAARRVCAGGCTVLRLSCKAGTWRLNCLPVFITPTQFCQLFPTHPDCMWA